MGFTQKHLPITSARQRVDSKKYQYVARKNQNPVSSSPRIGSSRNPNIAGGGSLSQLNILIGNAKRRSYDLDAKLKSICYFTKSPGLKKHINRVILNRSLKKTNGL